MRNWFLAAMLLLVGGLDFAEPPAPVPEPQPPAYQDETDDDFDACMDRCEADDEHNPAGCPGLCAGEED